MSDTFTPSLRLQLQATGNNQGTWGTIADTQYSNLEAAITGDNGYAGGSGGVSIAGLTVYTLTANNGTADQARELLYPFVGALAGDCTVTVPKTVKIGFAANFTTGGHNVILTSGSGGTLTLPPATTWTLFYCDGTNVGSVPLSTALKILSCGYLVQATNTGISANGTTLAAGTLLTAVYNQVSTAGGGNVALTLNTNQAIDSRVWVINPTASNLTVFPCDAGSQINALGAGNLYTVPAVAAGVPGVGTFLRTAATQFVAWPG